MPRKADGSHGPGPQRTRENDDDGVAAEVRRAAAVHSALGDGMEVAADDEWDAAGHRRHRRHQSIVLLEPAALPIRLGVLIVASHRDRMSGYHSPRLPALSRAVGGMVTTCITSRAAIRALAKPLPCRRQTLRLARKRLRAANVVEQDLSEPPGRSVLALPPDASSIGGTPRGPDRVRQVFRVIKLSGRTGEIEHELVGRERDDVVGRLVVVEIIVVVLHEEDRRRAAQRSILRYDLRAGRTQKRVLVGGAEYRLRPIESAGISNADRRRAAAFGRLRCS